MWTLSKCHGHLARARAWPGWPWHASSCGSAALYSPPSHATPWFANRAVYVNHPKSGPELSDNLPVPTGRKITSAYADFYPAQSKWEPGPPHRGRQVASLLIGLRQKRGSAQEPRREDACSGKEVPAAIQNSKFKIRNAIAERRMTGYPQK